MGLSPSITNNPIVRISYFHSKDNIANINRNVKQNTGCEMQGENSIEYIVSSIESGKEKIQNQRIGIADSYSVGNNC